MNQTQEDWSEYWANEGAAGEVFVGKDGRTHPALETFWRGQFDAIGNPDGDPDGEAAKVVDLACGAGSVFAHLDNLGQLELHGLDVSEQALELLNKRLPAVRTQTGSAAEPPYDLRSFDLVVSQFGIEYAGVDAFRAAAALVADGGRFAALAHYQDGHIDRKNRKLLSGAEAATEVGFADRALDLVKAGVIGDKAKQDEAADAFIVAERALAAEVENNREGLHAQLYLGFRHLFKERQHYQPQDILVWIAKAEGELTSALIRLRAMCAAALSEADTQRIVELFEAEQLIDIAVEPFVTPNNTLPIAWRVTARRGNDG